MVLMALRHAEASVLQKNAAVDVQKLLDRQTSGVVSDVPRLVAARQAVSEESRQLVCAAFDQAQGEYLQHRCTFETHSPRRAPRAVAGMFSCTVAIDIVAELPPLAPNNHCLV